MGVRKSVNFNVSQEAYDMVKEIFPDVIGTEDNLRQLVVAYKFWAAHKDDKSAEERQKEFDDLNFKYGEIVKARDEEIDRLRSENETLHQAAQKSEADAGEQDKEYQELNNKYQDLSNQLQAALSEREQLVSRISALETDGAQTWDNFKHTLPRFTVSLLEATAKRLSEYYEREITPMQIMTDMFLRYTIQRNAEWFYPFMLKDADIVAIAAEINPGCKNIRQIKQSLNFD